MRAAVGGAGIGGLTLAFMPALTSATGFEFARFPGFRFGEHPMATYRAYRVSSRRHFINAQWLEAPNDAAAIDQAEELCEEGAPTIELWQAARLVDEIDCEET